MGIAGRAAAIRAYRDDDLARIHAIYAHHVRTGRGSFELEPPTADEMAARLAALTEDKFPVLVADAEGGAAGYAYAGPFRPRAAYRYTVENSVYVAPERARQGIGAALLELLIAECRALGFKQMVAVLGDSNNLASIRLHEKLGFRRAGLLTDVGYKHERWLDIVLMQRCLDQA